MSTPLPVVGVPRLGLDAPDDRAWLGVMPWLVCAIAVRGQPRQRNHSREPM